MKMKHLIMALTTAAAPMLAAFAHAQISVKQVDEDTLRVIKKQGKPPYTRKVVNQADDPQMFAHYSEMVDYGAPATYIVHSRSGAPGKSVSRQRTRVDYDATIEEAEFARFEEVDEPANKNRTWHGAPGKHTSRFGK